MCRDFIDIKAPSRASSETRRRKRRIKRFNKLGRKFTISKRAGNCPQLLNSMLLPNRVSLSLGVVDTIWISIRYKPSPSRLSLVKHLRSRASDWQELTFDKSPNSVSNFWPEWHYRFTDVLFIVKATRNGIVLTFNYTPPAPEKTVWSFILLKIIEVCRVNISDKTRSGGFI